MTAPRSAARPVAPLIVGRAAELARFAAELEAVTPRLMLVEVQAGHGQTTYLHAAAAHAAECGWDVLVEDDRGEFTVTPYTTRDELVERLRAGLGIPLHDAVPAGSGDFVPAPQQDSARSTGGERCVEQLHRRPGKALLVIDGYRPSPRFDAWFTGAFLGELLAREDMSCSVVVADVAGALRTLTPLPHVCIELGALGRDDVARFWESLRDVPAPPLDARELEVFVDECVVRPELIAALNRLLRIDAGARPRPAAPVPEG